jgi:hypothetical protein
MSLTDLYQLADQNLPVMAFEGATPEAKMMSGFVLAKQYMATLIPQGHSVDLGAAITTQESYDAQMQERKEIVRASLTNKSDLPEEAALIAEMPKSKEYWISTYALASSGIGAYATGYAAQQVQYGLLSEKDYIDSITLRTKAFSNIVYAGQTGALAALVTPEAAYQRALEKSPVARTLMLSSQVRSTPTQGGALIVGSHASRVIAPTTPVSGLGNPAIVAIIAGAAVLAIVGSVYVAYALHASVEKERIRASAEFMNRMCTEAEKTGNEKTLAACLQYADKISTPTPQPFGMDQLSKYLVWGGVSLVALWMLPTLVDRFTRKR